MSSTKWKPLTNVPEGKPLPEEEVEFILIGAGSPFVGHLLIFSAGSPFAKCSLLFISPGLPRTGTMSTYAALEMILPGKCHHMARCWKGVFFWWNSFNQDNNRVGTDRTSRNVSFWPKAVDGKVTEEEWRDFVRDERLSAGVDYPISLFWNDLVKLYPNAKVIHWLRSWEFYWRSICSDQIKRFFSMIATRFAGTSLWRTQFCNLSDWSTVLPPGKNRHR